MPIRTRLIIIILSVVIIPMFFIGAISYLVAKNTMERRTLASLHTVSEFMEGKVYLYLDNLKTRTLDFSSDGYIRDSLASITSQYSKERVEKLNTYLIKNKKPLDNNLLSISILDLSGEIIASTNPRKIGASRHNEDYFIKGKEGNYVADIYKDNGVVVFDISAPLIDLVDPKKILGVIVNRYDAMSFNDLFTGKTVLEMGAKTQITSFGETGETYLVNEKSLMVTSSLFIEDAVLNQKVDTYPVKRALENNQETKGIWLDYRGVPVVGASVLINLGDFRWVLLSEQDVAEAFMPIYDLRRLLIILGVIVVILVTLVALSISQSISKPIQALHRGSEIIAGGELDYRVGTNEKDEIGQLSREFDKMVGFLKGRTEELAEVNEELRMEITERKRAEEALREKNALLQILQMVAVTANEATNVDIALKTILDKVCTHTGWPIGHVYVPAEDSSGQLKPTKLWRLEQPERFETFRKVTEETSFDPGIGLPGRVLSSRKPAWIIDVNKDPNFPRAQLAKNIGVRAGFGFPILVGSEVVAVLEFFSAEAVEPDKPLLEIMAHVGTQLGRVIERKRAEEALRKSEEKFRQSQKMEAVGRLAGGVAHDFNNLLTVINGFAEMRLHEMSPNDPVRADLEEILKAGQRATSLASQLLAFSRRQIFQPRVLNLNDLILGMDKMLRRLITANIELITIPGQDLGAVNVDPSHFEQILANLVINACDAMPEGGKLVIETKNVKFDQEYARQHTEVVPGDHILLSISDTGIGMSDEVKARIFEPYFTTKEKGKGTGLGLATSYGIVKQSGGSIEVYSELGQGACFKIYLLRVPEEAKILHRVESSKESPRGSEAVFVVEDEVVVRNFTVRVLRQQGYNVQEASNGEEALQLIEKRGSAKIHLFVTDIIMPKMGGKELAERLKSFYPDIRIVFMSGYTENIMLRKGKLEANDAFLQKPFTHLALAQKVREVLDR